MINSGIYTKFTTPRKQQTKDTEKHKIFESGFCFFTQIRPVLVDDLRTGEKNDFW